MHAEEDQFLAIPGLGGQITVMPPAAVEKLYEKIDSIPESDYEARQAADAFFAKAQHFSFDKQGRFALSETLRAHAGITKETVLVGSLSKFSIYSSERWTLIEQAQTPSSATGFLQKYQI